MKKKTTTTGEEAYARTPKKNRTKSLYKEVPRFRA